MNIKFFALPVIAAALGFSACGGAANNSNLAGKAANAANTVIKETGNITNSTANAVNSAIKEITTNSNTVNKPANTANFKTTNVNKASNHSERDGDK